MWFPERIRNIASVDVEPAIRALEKLDESDWLADEALKKKLAGDRPAQLLFFYSMSKEEYAAALAKGPIQQSDVKQLGAYDQLFDEFGYLFEAIQSHYPAGGVFLRAQIARMPPGGKIKEHKDNLLILENTHRLHIPIITTAKLKFFVDGERVTMEAGHIYELNNQLNHWVENPKDSINRVHLILDYLPPEYNIPASADENFKFYIREHRAGRKSKPSDVKVDLPKVVATVAHGDSQAGYSYAVYLIDFKNKASSKVIGTAVFDAGGASLNLSKAPYGVVVTDKEVVVAAGGDLHCFDKIFKYKTSYQTPFIKNARQCVYDGKYIYVVSQGTDSVVRFNIKKKLFDTAWRFYVDGLNKIAVKKISPEKDTLIESSNLFGLNSLVVNNGDFNVSGDQLTNVIKMKNGRIDSGEQIPRETSDMVSFAKGIAYLNANLNQVSYMADYDYRAIKSNSLVVASSFSTGLRGYQKGTLLAGTQPAGVVFLDMKNQDTAYEVCIDDSEASMVLALDVLQ